MSKKSTAPLALRVRRWKKSDIPAIIKCQNAAYPNIARESLGDARKLLMQLEAFPEGQFLAECDGEVAGYCTSLILQIDDDSPWYSYDEITGVGTFSTHDPSGETLYGSDIAVQPKYRGMGVAGKLYARRKGLLKRHNLRRMVAGGRIPGYAEQAKKMSAEKYIEKVKAGELKDMALSMHLKAGYDVLSVHYAYLNDGESMNYATYLHMDNPSFNPDKRMIAAAPLRRPVRKIRVCAAQYQMRPIKCWDDLERQVQFFVETADEYHCHFLLFPEMFTAQLFSILSPNMDSLDAVKEVARFHEQYLEMFTRFAEEHSLYIIGGSHPVEIDGELRNVAHLFTPRGDVHTQEKIHITSVERKYYDIQPGDKLRVFETPLGRIGILICYDIEFPELARLLTLHGIEVLFVPFATDERKSYFRVRHCAQARAVENIIYVVMTGCIGNLPQVRSFLVNYGRAAICTPCDIAFPSDGIMEEADPGSETVIISELDLNDLAMARDIGSVKPLQDRRTDLYSLTSKFPIEIVSVL
ncbi:MAG: bifunctional GNAT family N-acetyltransferase/carbon-nitrogen hydrolase family protein [Pseudohongiellaceae bacterium]